MKVGFSDRQRGYLGAVSSNLIWGIAPLYFSYLVLFPMAEIIAHRALWAAVFLLVILLATGQGGALAQGFVYPRRTLSLAAGAIMVTANWTAYLYAVDTNQLVQSALGYFLYPLMAIGLGVVVLGERLGRRGWLALFCATAGVGLKVTLLDGLPFVALAIGSSFAFYALIRKRLDMDPFLAMVIELLMIAPLALALITYLTLTGKPAGASFFLDGTYYGILMAFTSGIITSVPLVLFHIGNRYLPLSVAGFLFYLNPSLQLLLGLLVFAEPFTNVDMVAFTLIWVALVLQFAPTKWLTSNRP
ncbi:MAG: EamA family transporter RarD [Candidatus Puniceispirillaceae bacterium]